MPLAGACRGAPWLAALGFFVACDPCEDLEAKLCRDLGEEDCAIWRAPPVDKAGIGSETMTSESCANTQSGPTYDRMLEAARIAIHSRKKALEREEGTAP